MIYSHFSILKQCTMLSDFVFFMQPTTWDDRQTPRYDWLTDWLILNFYVKICRAVSFLQVYPPKLCMHSSHHEILPRDPPSHPLDLVTVIKRFAQHKSWRFPLCNCLYPRTFSLVRPDIFLLCTLFPNTLRLCRSLKHRVYIKQDARLWLCRFIF